MVCSDYHITRSFFDPDHLWYTSDSLPSARLQIFRQVQGSLLLQVILVMTDVSLKKLLLMQALTSEFYPACPIDKNAPFSRHVDYASTSSYLLRTTWPLVTQSDSVMTVPHTGLPITCTFSFLLKLFQKLFEFMYL